MYPRPLRANIYKPLLRLGLYTTDWPWVLLPAGLAYLVPFLFSLWVGYLPLGVITGTLTFVGLFAFLSYVRRRKLAGWPRYWLLAWRDRWHPFRAAQPGEFSLSWRTTKGE
jgi:hypothetical protein